MRSDQKRWIKLSLLLFGSFTLGENLAAALHELGHAIVMWATGGLVQRITLNPFSWSYTYYGSVPKYPLLTSSAGIVFGTVSGLVLTALVWKFRHQSWSLIFIMTGIGATATNGSYAIVDSLLLSGGDATYLIRHGLPAILIICVGIVLLLGSLLLAIAALRSIDFGPNSTMAGRALVLEAGILPYFLAIVVYNYIVQPREIMLWSVYAGGGAVMLLVVAAISALIDSRFQSHPFDISKTSWAYTWSVVILSLLVLSMELVLFH